MDQNLKEKVRDFWDEASCGEVYAQGDSEKKYYESQAQERYKLEPYLAPFAKFHEAHEKDVLEVGVGMGADHIMWAQSGPRSLRGVDLTPRAVEHTKKRFALYGFASDVTVADAEKLPMNDESFDIVYSWGVLHHSPQTQAGIDEIFRVLRPGGTARIMIYHRYSLTGYMLWIRYALLTGHLSRSLKEIYAQHLESPGTKAFSIEEARNMFARFSHVQTQITLSSGDLLEGAAGQRHSGILLSIARLLWPRTLMKKLFKNHGLLLMIEAQK